MWQIRKIECKRLQIFNVKPSSGEKAQISFMGNLHLKKKWQDHPWETFIWGKKYKYLLGIAIFWGKIQISSRDCLLFEKKHKYLSVTATFSVKQRIPRVRRLLFE